MQDQLKKIRQVKRKFESEWLEIEGIVAIGIGLTKSGDMGILVSTNIDPKHLRAKIPPMAENIPIELQQSGEIKAL